MTAPGPVDAELLRRCHRNCVEGLWQYVRVQPGATRREVREGTLIRCQLPSIVTNIAFLIDPAAPQDELVREANAFFGAERPWRLIVAGVGSEEVGAAALRLGLRPGPNEPGMLLDPIRSTEGPPPSLTIRPVEDATTLRDFGTPFCEAFRLPSWVLPLALPRVPPDDTERGARNRFFVGYVDGKPVACATVTVTERVAGVASVGTVPKARGRGYGTAITAKAAEVGASLGAEVAYLAATPMGYPVYERMGFRRVAEYPSWRVPVGFFQRVRMVSALRRLLREATVSSTSSGATPPTSR